jgi:hypothetical protein
MEADRLVSVPTMWQCPNCGEEHHDGFDICWKCGSDPAGNSDPDFHISEPIREQDQTPDFPTNDKQLPSLELPTVTYFSIPPYICISLIMMFNDLEHFAANQVPDFSLSPIDILVYFIATVLIGIPIFIAMARAMFLCIIRRQNLSNSLTELLWMLSMFRLPETIRRSQHWFVPAHRVSRG